MLGLRGLTCLLAVVWGSLGCSEEMTVEKSAHPSLSLGFELLDLQGKQHALSTPKVRVFIFLSTTCPISNSYIPTLNKLAEEHRHQVDVFGVICDEMVTRQEASAHFAKFKATFPILFDASDLLARELGPTHLPESFVIGDSGKLLYRGAINNAYESLGRRRPQVEHHYLNAAIESALKGEVPVTTSVPPVGCLFPSDRGEQTMEVTYTRHIAPLVQSRCQTCHRPGQMAPFPLTAYREVKTHAEMMAEVTERRLMPPWMPGPNSQPPLVGERWLSDAELKLIKDWVNAGCPEGNPEDLPPPAEFAEGWQLGKPDLVVKMSEMFTVPADGPDLLQNFVIPIVIPEDKLVAAVEFHPGNKRVVHHAVLFLDDKGQARKLDAATLEPGYSNFGGPGFLPSGALGGWSVGNTARRLPNEMGRYLKVGSDLVVQVHYHPTGREEQDQSEIGLFFVDHPVAESLSQPAKLVGSIWMANYEMDIPAGNANYLRSTIYRLPKEVVLVGIVPHMHLLGKSMRVTATRPNGEPETLIDIERWNYNWQDEYYYEQPFTLPAGTVLKVEAAFDNSAANPSNPSSPPKRVTWGEETTDEMLFCFFLITSQRTEDLIHTIFDNLGHDTRQPRKEVGRAP